MVFTIVLCYYYCFCYYFHYHYLHHFFHTFLIFCIIIKSIIFFIIFFSLILECYILSFVLNLWSSFSTWRTEIKILLVFCFPCFIFGFIFGLKLCIYIGIIISFPFSLPFCSILFAKKKNYLVTELLFFDWFKLKNSEWKDLYHSSLVKLEECSAMKNLVW